MGFDLYGMNPVVNKKYPPRFNEIMKEYGTKDGEEGWLDWSKDIPEDVKEEYFELNNSSKKIIQVTILGIMYGIGDHCGVLYHIIV